MVVGADGALATAKRLYTEAKGTGHAIELATADVIEQAERLNKQLNGNSARNIFTASKRIVEEVEREAGFVVRTGKDLIGKHQEWVTKGSSSRAFGIACTEMALGSVMTSMGTQMLSTAIGGQRQKAVETNVGPDGTVTLTGVFVPIPKTERVIKAVIGGATTATGIAATASGFFNIFRGM